MHIIIKEVKQNVSSLLLYIQATAITGFCEKAVNVTKGNHTQQEISNSNTMYTYAYMQNKTT